MKPLATSAGLVLAVAASLALAQGQKPTAPQAASGAGTNAPAPAAPPRSNATAAPQPGGAQGTAGSVQPCVACHGAQGAGNPQGGIPRIAGQPEAYLRKQLDNYADGSRRNAVMQPIAKALSREARTATAAYFSALAPAGTNRASSGPGANADATTGRDPAAASAGAGRPAASRGAELATVGDERIQLQACGNCHGPGGVGEPPNVPYLAGQDAAYLTAALNAFKSGARRNDAGAQMRTVVDGMSADDIASVAQYFATQAPPAQPAPQNVVRSPRDPVLTARPAAGGPNGARAASSTHSSGGQAGAVGSEQGAGTTGGSQGPGGIDQGSRSDKPAPAKGR